jgi:hypothetical protein
MTKKIKVSELPEFDATEYLNSEEDIAASGLLAMKDDVTSIKLELAEIKSEQKLMKWILGLLLAGVATLILKVFF